MITAHHQVFGRKYGGLYLSYNFNGNLNDSSGNNRNATQNGTITYTTGRKGIVNTAIQFGSGDVVTPIIPELGMFSFSFWIKTTDNTAGTGRAIISKSSPVNGSLEFSILINSGKIRCETAAAAVEYINVKESLNVINDNNWHYVVCVFDLMEINPSNEIKIYIDGIQASVNSIYNNNTTPPLQPMNIVIGRKNTNTFWFNGVIDDLEFYNKILTQAEITNLYNK